MELGWEEFNLISLISKKCDLLNIGAPKIEIPWVDIGDKLLGKSIDMASPELLVLAIGAYSRTYVKPEKWEAVVKTMLGFLEKQVTYYPEQKEQWLLNPVKNQAFVSSLVYAVRYYAVDDIEKKVKDTISSDRITDHVLAYAANNLYDLLACELEEDEQEALLAQIDAGNFDGLEEQATKFLFNAHKFWGGMNKMYGQHFKLYSQGWRMNKSMLELELGDLSEQ